MKFFPHQIDPELFSTCKQCQSPKASRIQFLGNGALSNGEHVFCNFKCRMKFTSSQNMNIMNDTICTTSINSTSNSVIITQSNFNEIKQQQQAQKRLIISENTDNHIGIQTSVEINSASLLAC